MNLDEAFNFCDKDKEKLCSGTSSHLKKKKKMSLKKISEMGERNLKK